MSPSGAQAPLARCRKRAALIRLQTHKCCSKTTTHKNKSQSDVQKDRLMLRQDYRRYMETNTIRLHGVFVFSLLSLSGVRRRIARLSGDDRERFFCYNVCPLQCRALIRFFCTTFYLVDDYPDQWSLQLDALFVIWEIRGLTWTLTKIITALK